MAEGRWQTRALRDALPDLDRQELGADPARLLRRDQHRHLVVGRVPADGSGREPADRPRVGLADRAQRRLALGGRRVHAPRRGPRPGPRRQARPAGRGQRRVPRAARPGRRRAPLAGHAEPRATTFTTVPAGVAVSAAGFEGAVAGLTAVRRAIRRPHEDSRRLPVIFNDYMNTLMGNPTTERLLPLIDAAARGRRGVLLHRRRLVRRGRPRAGGTRSAPWKPSRPGFPAGSPRCSTASGTAGMVPGLWLEPEVVGVNSPIARQLPAEAFFQRGGQLVVEHGRYHLDLRHPAAVKHLDEVVDFLVGDLGVGYLKFDYNIAVGPGPGHRRAERRRGAARGQPGAARLAGRRARPASPAGDRELLVRRDAHRLRAAVAASSCSPPATSRTTFAIRRSQPPHPPPSPRSRPPSGPTRSRSSPTTRSPSRWAARCSAASTCPVTSTG